MSLLFFTVAKRASDCPRACRALESEPTVRFSLSENRWVVDKT